MDFTERNPLSVSSMSAAVEQNATETLRRLIRKGRSTNITDNRGWTPLHEAAALGHLRCLTILLEAGARVNVTTHKGETAFLIACKYNRMEVINKLLLWDNTLIDMSNNESVTPLHMACTDHNLPLVKHLLKKGANINAEDNSGMTPLHEAIMAEDVEISRLLIENGASLTNREYDGHTTFHFACMTGSLEILRLLITNYKGDVNVLNVGNRYGFTPLMFAVQSRSIEMIEELLHMGVSANKVNNRNHLAIHLAAHTGNLDILKCVFKATSGDAINKYCTISGSVLEDIPFGYSNYETSMETGLVSLVLDSESIECLDFILNCGLSHDVLNCPLIKTERIPTHNEGMHLLTKFGPHKNIEIEVDITDFVIANGITRTRVCTFHPISFLLKEQLLQFGKEAVKYLKIMLENGLTFDHNDFQVRELLVLHPYEAMLFNAQSNCTDSQWREVAIDCMCLMIDHGISIDYDVELGNESIPVLFVYACRLPFLEMIPHLLRNSNFVDIDDLLRWVVHKIFMRIDPPPHMIEKPMLDTYKYLTKYTSTSVKNFVHEIRRPEYESRYNEVLPFIDAACSTSCIPSLQIMCRSVIRRTVKDNCRACPHQLKMRMNGLELPASLLSYLNYSDMLELPL